MIHPFDSNYQAVYHTEKKNKREPKKRKKYGKPFDEVYIPRLLDRLEKSLRWDGLTMEDLHKRPLGKFYRSITYGWDDSIWKSVVEDIRRESTDAVARRGRPSPHLGLLYEMCGEMMDGASDIAYLVTFPIRVPSKTLSRIYHTWRFKRDFLRDLESGKYFRSRDRIWRENRADRNQNKGE